MSRECTRLKRENRLIMTIAARQALGMYFIQSIKKNKQKAITSGVMSVLTGVFDPILLMSDDRLREPVLGYAEKKQPTTEQLPRAMSS